MAKYVYQIVVTGTGILDDGFGQTTFKSLTVFATEELAQRRINNFLKIATDSSVKINALDKNKPIEIKITPIEVIEE